MTDWLGNNVESFSCETVVSGWVSRRVTGTWINGLDNLRKKSECAPQGSTKIIDVMVFEKGASESIFTRGTNEFPNAMIVR